MSKINTNMAAVTALYHLKQKEGAQNQAIERISSGLRLNHALDDAAGASIVGRMTSQIKGLEAAMRNAADAISLTQTAEGALDEVSSILHRMRELSVQAANGVYSGMDRQAIQNEVGQIQIELSRIAQNSTFNAVKMLNGDFTNTAFQIGFQPNDTAILSIENVDPTGLGEYLTTTDQVTNSNARFKPAGSPVAAHRKSDFSARIQETENLTIFGNVGNVTIDVNGGSSAKDVAASITSRLSETGVSATAQTRMNVAFEEEPSGTQTTDTVSFNVYGKNTAPVLISANVTFGETNGRGANLTDLAAAINGTTGKTGISASLSIDKSTMTMISNDGYDIATEDYRLVAVQGPAMLVSGANEDNTSVTGTNSVNVLFDALKLEPGTDTSTHPNSAQVSGQVTFRSPFIFSVKSDNIGTSSAPDLMSPRAPYKSTTASSADPENFIVPAGTYVVTAPAATVSSSYKGVGTVSPATGNTNGTKMTLQVTVNGSNTVTAVQILNAGSAYEFGGVLRIPAENFGQADGNGFVELVLNGGAGSGTTNETITASGGMFSGNPSGAQLSSVAALDVLTVANAKKMLTAVDGALVRVDLERSDLGATMSRMEHVINNLSNIVKNTQEARSRIQDADIALETTNLTKAQVLNQAAQAMLAQANRTSQSIMSLLQN
jgi:flagellin